MSTDLHRSRAAAARTPSTALAAAVLCSLCGLMPGSLAADDWPQWLGPERDSVWRESGIVERFPESGPVVKWRAPIRGGYAGPAVADGRVFVTDYVTEGDQSGSPSRRNELEGVERVLCFSVANGALLWKHESPRSYRVSYPAGPRATPCVDGDRVYTLGAEGHLFCLDVQDGSVVWSRSFKEDFGATTPIWGFCGHPLVYGDTVYCVVGGEGSVAVALNKHTGKELWRALSAREPGYCPPTLIESAGEPQLIIWHAESINSLDPATGKRHWSIDLAPDFGMAIATPRQNGNLLFAGGKGNNSVLLKLGEETPSADVLWRGTSERGISPINSTPFIEGEYLYGVDSGGQLTCVELATGKQIWATTEPITGSRPANSGTAFLVRNGDRYFLFCENGDLAIARLSPKGYTELDRANILEPTYAAFNRPVIWSHPAFAQKCLFARNDKELVCVSLAKE